MFPRRAQIRQCQCLMLALLSLGTVINTYIFWHVEVKYVHYVRSQPDISYNILRTDRKQPDTAYSIKVEQPGFNVKVPEWEIYVLSAFAVMPKHRRDASPYLPNATFTAAAFLRPGDGSVDRELWTDTATLDRQRWTTTVRLVTWTHKALIHQDNVFYCCVASGGNFNNLQAAIAIHREYHGVKSQMTHAEFDCAVHGSELVTHVAFGRHNCSEFLSPFMAVERAEDPANSGPSGSGNRTQASVALCLPALYGSLPVRGVVEWLELQRLVGVSRIHVHYTELDTDLLSALTFYQQQGLVTLRSFRPAVLTGRAPRSMLRSRSRQALQAWMDAWILLNDCKYRLFAYDVIMVLDPDELLIPTPPFKSLPQVFEAALTRFPNVSYFASHTYIHLYEWGPSYSSPVSFLQYLNRTDSNMLDSRTPDRSSPKTIFVPSRVEDCTRLIHRKVKGFKKYTLTTDLAFLHHYRHCKKKSWGQKCFTWTRVRTEQLLQYQSQWEKAVQRFFDLHPKLKQENKTLE